MNWNMVKQISLINTLKLNIYYFGWRTVLCPIIIASRNLKIVKLSGKVIANDKKIGAIKIGFGNIGIVDKKYSRSMLENDGIIIFSGRANLGLGMKIVCHGKLTIGDGCIFNANSNIICEHQITFDEGSMISWECLFMDTDFHPIYDFDGEMQINLDRPIVIGKHVWIGCRSTVLKGSQIPNNSIIAAGSLVTKTLTDENCIYASNVKLRSGIRW